MSKESPLQKGNYEIWSSPWPGRKNVKRITFCERKLRNLWLPLARPKNVTRITFLKSSSNMPQLESSEVRKEGSWATYIHRLMCTQLCIGWNETYSTQEDMTRCLRSLFLSWIRYLSSCSVEAMLDNNMQRTQQNRTAKNSTGRSKSDYPIEKP